jgi:NAD dependent epimerase/dehydratase
VRPESQTARNSRPSVVEIASPALITGAGGFIGSHLSELCVERGLDVRAFVHYNAQGRRGWLDHSPCGEHIEVIAGDIRDYDAVARAMEGCRTVFHVAALVGIPYSYASPLAYVRTNVEGAYNVLEAARRLEVENLVMTSTSETYGTARQASIDESAGPSAQSPYAATKVAADALALSYSRSFGLPVKIARPFNAYGPRQSARAFIPTVIAQILSGSKTVRVGSLSPTRDLTYVTDTARGFVEIARRPALNGSATHIGANREISMADLARKIAGLMGVEVRFESEARRERPALSEVERLRADNSRLLEHTDWRPLEDLDSGLEKTIAWMRENQGLYRPGDYAV